MGALEVRVGVVGSPGGQTAGCLGIMAVSSNMSMQGHALYMPTW